MKFLTGEPAMLIGRGKDKSLVVSDLHIGIEYEFFKSGVKLPSQTSRMTERLERLLRKTKPKRLVLLGDVKHKVPGTSFQELREIPEFINYFSKKVPVEIVPGNHDAGIEKLVPNVRIHKSSGTLIGDSYLAHGHAWPSEEFLEAKQLIVGHIQPQVEFREKLGHVWREPVWVKTVFNKKKIQEKYRTKEEPPDIVIMPSFNSFSGGYAINSRKGDRLLGPILKSASLPSSELYLLDGTFLGRLKDLK